MPAETKCTLPSNYTIRGAVPVVASPDCTNVPASAKLWAGTQVAPGYWQLSSPDRSLCLMANSADTFADKYGNGEDLLPHWGILMFNRKCPSCMCLMNLNFSAVYMRTVAAPCATLGPSTSLSNAQLYTVRASPVGGKNAFIVPTTLPDPRSYGQKYGMHVCYFTAACSQYSPDGGYDALIAFSFLADSVYPTDWAYADPSETVNLVAKGEH